MNCLCQYLSVSKPDSHAITRRVIQGKCLPPSDVSVKRCNNFLIIFLMNADTNYNFLSYPISYF